MNETLENEGFKPGEIQISSKALTLLEEYFKKEINHVMENTIEIVKSTNLRFGHNKIKRISPQVVKTALFWDK